MQAAISGATHVLETALMVGEWIPGLSIAAGCGRATIAVCQVAGGFFATGGGLLGGLTTAVVPGIFGYTGLSRWCFSWMRFGAGQMVNSVSNGLRATIAIAPLPIGFFFTPIPGIAFGLFNPLSLFLYDSTRGLVAIAS